MGLPILSCQALVDYASIILGIIGAPEHQELCWHNRYTFLIRWPECCKLANSFDRVLSSVAFKWRSLTPDLSEFVTCHFKAMSEFVTLIQREKKKAMKYPFPVPSLSPNCNTKSQPLHHEQLRKAMHTIPPNICTLDIPKTSLTIEGNTGH